MDSVLFSLEWRFDHADAGADKVTARSRHDFVISRRERLRQANQRPLRSTTEMTFRERDLFSGLFELADHFG